MKTDSLKEILTSVGGDSSSLPDNLLSTHYEAIIKACGGTVDDLPDRLETTYLKRIATVVGGGGNAKPIMFWVASGSDIDIIWLAIEGTKWSAWVNSDLNNGNFTISNNIVYYRGQMIVSNSDTAIVANKTYSPHSEWYLKYNNQTLTLYRTNDMSLVDFVHSECNTIGLYVDNDDIKTPTGEVIYIDFRGNGKVGNSSWITTSLEAWEFNMENNFIAAPIADGYCYVEDTMMMESRPQFVIGMTWQDYVDSTYNNDYAYISEGQVMWYGMDGEFVLKYGGEVVKPTDTIINTALYTA